MDVDLLIVPYDTGRRGWRMGAGPEHVLRGGLVERLRSAGHAVVSSVIEAEAKDASAEIATAFLLMRRIAGHVREAIGAGRFPLVLSGNCNSACGTLSGIPQDSRAVFWFDAHGDCNTPETTQSGFLDGSALATALGWCWRSLASTIPGFRPVHEDSTLLLGARDLDSLEADLVHRSGVRVLSSEDLRAGRLAPALAELRSQAAYVHCDLDVLDPSVGQANPFPAVAGGLDVQELEQAIRTIARGVPLRAAALTAYAPESDVEGRILDAALHTIDVLVDSAAGRR